LRRVFSLVLSVPFPLTRAQHITKSLTVENVPYEVFSTFSATFEVVRKVNYCHAGWYKCTEIDNDGQVEVKYFLDHWAEIRSSDAMRNVWHQIRLGRHPGFEEGSQAIAPLWYLH